MATQRKVYDHRLRELLVECNDPELRRSLGVPRGTLACWKSRGLPEVVWLEGAPAADAETQQQLAEARRTIAQLQCQQHCCWAFAASSMRS